MSNLDALFRPYQLNALSLPNRVAMAPMTRSFSPNGIPDADVAAYYRRRAEHGVGLIITEGTGVERDAAVNEPCIPRFHGDAALAGWKNVVDAVHEAGGRIAPQLWHVGVRPSPAAPGWNPPGSYEGPSGLSPLGEPMGHPMTENDVADTVDSFARAARSAQRLGFDAVELHGAHNYLINQFFWGYLNLRTDRYGGASLVERSRFAAEIVQAVRAQVGPRFPIILRLSQWRAGDFNARLAQSPQELEKWLSVLVGAGTDALHLSQPKFRDPAFPEVDRHLNLAGWAKKLTGVTTITVGSVGLSGDVYESFGGKGASAAPLDELVQRLDCQEFDLVAVGRALLQDPAWLDKIRRRRFDQISNFHPDAFRTLA